MNASIVSPVTRIAILTGFIIFQVIICVRKKIALPSVVLSIILFVLGLLQNSFWIYRIVIAEKQGIDQELLMNLQLIDDTLSVGIQLCLFLVLLFLHLWQNGSKTGKTGDDLREPGRKV